MRRSILSEEHFKVEAADSHRILACHRLDQKEDAGIIVRFCDLSERNSWLSKTKNLKASPLRVSISPDLPPSLRPLKAKERTPPRSQTNITSRVPTQLAVHVRNPENP